MSRSQYINIPVCVPLAKKTNSDLQVTGFAFSFVMTEE